MKADERQVLSDKAQAALVHLWKAFVYSRDAEVDVWQLAIPLPHLVELGVGESDLRWLVLRGYAGHGEEFTRFSDVDRRFRPAVNVAFTSRTCFVLTDAGAALAEDCREAVFLTPPSSPWPRSHSQPSASSTISADGPCWDADLRVLRFDRTVVKQYRRPAPNQERVLSAFEESSWPEQIDDPLPQVGEVNPKHRLGFTIARLNGGQEKNLMTFHGDGTGQGVRWAGAAETISAQGETRRLPFGARKPKSQADNSAYYAAIR